jgi:HEPN domain-containing protein
MATNEPTANAPEPNLERIGSTLFHDMLERFVAPEMTRRETSGDWPAGTAVYRFQVLLPWNGPIEVRLNHEVGGEALVKAARPIEKGQEVTTEDIAGIEKYIPRPDDADIPHVTGFAHSAGWSIAFEFGYRHPRRHDFLTLAHQFAATARDALRAGRVGVALDNAFSAAELLAKAELLSCAPTIEAALAARTHGSVHEPYNLWGRLENTDRRFVDLLNRLSALRRPARYLHGELRLKPGEPESVLEDLSAMEAHVDGVATGDAASALPHGYNVISTREITAGQLVHGADFSFRPQKT